MTSETKNWKRRVEQKAEELYEDGWCTSYTPQFSVDEHTQKNGLKPKLT